LLLTEAAQFFPLVEPELMPFPFPFSEALSISKAKKSEAYSVNLRFVYSIKHSFIWPKNAEVQRRKER